MNWTDIYEIAIALEDKHPNTDIGQIKFVDLWKMVQNLPGFNDHASLCNEKILEAIQTAWIDERD